MKSIRIPMYVAFPVMAALATVAAVGESNSPLGLSLSIGAKFTDNRDHVPSGTYVIDNVVRDKEDNTELWITPTISFDWEKEGVIRLALRYSPSFTWYDNPRSGSEESKWHHAVNARMEYFVSPQTTLTLSDNLWFTGAKDWYYESDFDPTWSDVEKNDDYYENRTDASIRHELGPEFYTTLAGYYRFKAYDDSELASFNDEDEFGVDLSIMKRMSRTLSLGVFGSYTSFDKDTKHEVDVGVDYINVGLQLTYDMNNNGRVVVNARTGYNSMFYESDAIDDDSRLGDSSLELELFKHEQTSGKLGIRYGDKYTSVYPYSSEEEFAVYGSVTRRWGAMKKLATSLHVEYRMKDYELAKIDPEALKHNPTQYSDDWDGSRDAIWVRASVDYKWTDDFSTSVFYTYEDIDSDVDVSYKENVFGLRATYKFL